MWEDFRRITLSLFQYNTSELQHELKVLKQAKAEAENKVAALEKAVSSSSQHAREANEALAKVREESRFLKELLSHEQDAARSKINEAKVIEQGLRRKIQTITAQLAECKQEKAVAAQSMEARLRSQIEKEYTKQDGDVRSLRESLKNAQTTLYAMQTERTSTLRSIHQALGKPTDGVRRAAVMLGCFKLIFPHSFILLCIVGGASFSNGAEGNCGQHFEETYHVTINNTGAFEGTNGSRDQNKEGCSGESYYEVTCVDILVKGMASLISSCSNTRNAGKRCG